MPTQFATAPDGVRIAYETFGPPGGSGPPLILLHGGGQSRRNWIEAGYPARWAGRRQVIAMDFRGNGESGKPGSREAYAPDVLRADLLAVADACGAERFDLVGYSFGGNTGRYFAAMSPRIARFVMIGVGFGPGSSGAFRARLEGMLAPFEGLLRGEGDEAALSEAQLAQWRDPNMRPLIALFSALLDYPSLEPGDLPCPTLWLVGGGNEVGALAEVERLRDALPSTNVTFEMVGSLNHAEELTAIDEIAPPIERFLDL